MASRHEAADLGPRLALIITLGLGGHLALTSFGLLAFGGSEDLESFLYLGAFVLILPAAMLSGTRLARTLARSGQLGSVTAIAASGLLVLLVGARGLYALDGAATVGTPAFASALVLWAAGTAALVLAVDRKGALPLANWLAPATGRLWVAPTVLLTLLLLGFPPSRVMAPVPVAAGLALAALLMGLYLVLVGNGPGRRLGIALDLASLATLLVLANDVQLYADADQFYRITSNLHQNFYLGPTNDVLHGRPMLVDTFSQYGAGLFYMLAAWFSLTTIGYGAMTLLSAILTAAEIAVVYCILRMGHASRPLACAGGAVAGIALFFAGTLPAPTSHPSTGGLRYLLPYFVVAAGVAGARRAHERAWGWATAALVGLSSIWSVEAFAYSAAALAGMAVLRTAVTGRAARHFLRALAPAAVMVLVAQVAFAGLTLVLAGQWPDWGGYLAFLGSYSVDGISALPIEPWSPGIAISAAYFASLAGIVALSLAQPAFVRSDRATLTALAGILPFAVVSFTYFIGNSFSDAALSVGLPGFVAAGLWLALLERHRDRVSPVFGRIALVATAWLLATLAVFAWPTIRDRASDTPLAMALPDSGRGGSLTNELARMWRSEPLDARNAPAEVLIRRHFPGRRPVPTVATTENTVTVLMETGRVNAFPVSHFLQEGLVMSRSWARVGAKIEGLRPGTLVLTERQALDRVYPAPLLDRTIAALRHRFRFQFVDGDPNAFFVVRLVPRADPGAAKRMRRSLRKTSR